MPFTVRITAVLLWVSVGAGAAQGGLALIDVEETDSSQFTFEANLTSSFDFVGFRIAPGSESVASFLDPTFPHVFADSGLTTAIDWQPVLQRPFLASAGGSARNDLGWRMDFSQDADVPFDMDIAFFNGDSLIATFRFPWTGEPGAFVNFQAGAWEPQRSELSEIIPLPHPAALAGAGLVGLAGMRRRW